MIITFDLEHIIYGFCLEELTFKKEYRNLDAETLYDAICKNNSVQELLHMIKNPDTDMHYIGVFPGYTKQETYFDTREELNDWLISIVEKFTTDNKENLLNSYLDEFHVFTGDF